MTGPILVAAGQPIVPKTALKYIEMRGFVTPGATWGTSPASILSRSIGLGGGPGRAVPGLGWLLTYKDVMEVQHNANIQFTQGKSMGNYLTDTYSDAGLYYYTKTAHKQDKGVWDAIWNSKWWDSNDGGGY